MTTPWKTWMRERLPSTTRTCTLTVSPGRKSGMSWRNESASRASRVFISAVLSPSSGSMSVRAAGDPAVLSGELRLQLEAPGSCADGYAAAIYCATSSVDDARGPGPGATEQLRQPPGELRRDELLGAVGDLLRAPPAVGLVLEGLQLGLPAHVDLVDD